MFAAKTSVEMNGNKMKNKECHTVRIISRSNIKKE
jgi:hypothetical protein